MAQPSVVRNLRVNSYSADGTGAIYGWDAPLDDGGYPITFYRVYERQGVFTEPDLSFDHLENASDTLSSIANRNPGETWTVFVSAINSNDEESEWSERLLITLANVPGVPPSLRITRDGTSATVTWSAANARRSPITAYQVRRNAGTTPGGTYQTLASTARSHTFTGLTAGQIYTYQVRATNGVGNGNPRTARVPGSPTDLTATSNPLSILVSWTAPTDSGSSALTKYQYRYQAGSSAGGTWTDVIGTEVLITGLAPLTEYTIDVRAVNSSGASVPSDSVTVTTLEFELEAYWDFASLSDVAINTYKSLLVQEDRIYLTRDNNQSTIELEAFDRDGDAVTADDLDFGLYTSGRLEAVAPFGKNRILAVFGNASEGIGGRVVVIRDFAEGQGRYGAFEPRGSSEGSRLKDIKSVIATREGIMLSDGGDSALTNATTAAGIYLLSYEDVVNSLRTDESDERPAYSSASFNDGDEELEITRNDLLATDGERVYVAKGTDIWVYDSGLQLLSDETIPIDAIVESEELRDMTVFDERLYVLTTHRIWRIDLLEHRAPVAKQTIYPQIIAEGGSLELMKLVVGADRIEWEDGYTPPSYLSIDSSYNLDAGSVSEDQTVLVKLTAFNDIGTTETGAFSFYLTVLANAAPTWADVSTIPMTTSDTLNLRRLAPDADSFAWKSGFTEPTELSLSDGKISFDSVPDATRLEVQLTATNTHGSTDETFSIDVIKTSREVEYSDTFRYRVEIEGIDVTDDLIVGRDGEGNTRESVFTVSENLDVIRVNTRTVGDCEFTLDNNDGRYNTYIDDNFWDANNLNPGGYQSEIKLFVDSLVDGSYVAQLLFSGVIVRTHENVTEATIDIICVDESSRLRNASFGDFGLEKQAHLFRQDEDSYEGIYTPETSLRPIRTEGKLSAYAGESALTLKNTLNQSEFVAAGDAAFVSASDLRTEGGYIDERPLLKFLTPHRQRIARFVIDALVDAANLYNASVDIDLRVLDDAFGTNRGNIAFNVEPTRIQRTPVDWVYDETNGLLYILLSNPEAYVSDLLVRCEVGSGTYQTLHDFGVGVAVHRIESTDFDTFYILATESTSIDSSRVPLPVRTNEIARQYDATQQQNAKIIRYVISTQTETANFVSKNNARSPQLAAHYFVGFANKNTLHEHEALLPSNRGNFKAYNSQIYYRYATASAFGVARVNAAGTTTARFSETPDAYYNAQNFGFDVAPNGDVFFAYCAGGEHNEDTELTVKKRTSGGTTTTVLTDAKALHELTDLEEVGGAYAGVHEVFFDGVDQLYIVVQVQRVRYADPDDTSDTGRYRKYDESAGTVLYRINTTGTASLNVIETYDFTHFSCRSLASYQNSVYLFENPHEAYQYRPIVRSLETYNASLGYNLLPDNSGGLRKIENDYSVASEGVLWFETAAYYGVQTKALVFDEQLHVVVGYSRFDELMRANSGASQPNNSQWISYGNQLDYVLPDIPADGTIFEALSDIALKTGTLFSVQRNLVRFQENVPFRAKVNGSIGTTLPFDGENRTFPSAGYIIIGGEIIGYTGVSGSAFTGLTRGVLGSPVETHADNADTLYLDNIINADSLNDPYQDIAIRLDTHRFYNVVRDSAGITEQREDSSIETYGERTYELSLGLTRHEAAWIDHIGDRYLDDLKELRYFVEVTLVPSNYIRLGDVISFFYAGQLLVPIRVVGITYTADNTRIIGRSV